MGYHLAIQSESALLLADLRKRGFWASRETRQEAQIFLRVQIKNGELADGRLNLGLSSPGH